MDLGLSALQQPIDRLDHHALEDNQSFSKQGMVILRMRAVITAPANACIMFLQQEQAWISTFIKVDIQPTECLCHLLYL